MPAWWLKINHQMDDFQPGHGRNGEGQGEKIPRGLVGGGEAFERRPPLTGLDVGAENADVRTTPPGFEGSAVEKNGSLGPGEEDFLLLWEKLRGFARGWAIRLLGQNPEAEEVGEEAFFDLVVSWVQGRYPGKPFGWLKRVVWRLCSRNGHVFHSKMYRAGGEEDFFENIPAPDRGEKGSFEGDRERKEEDYLQNVVLPALTPGQKMDLLALRREGCVKKAARARGKAPANFRKSLRAIEKKVRNLQKNVPPPHLKVEGKEKKKRAEFWG